MSDESRSTIACCECHGSFPDGDGLLVEGEFFCEPCWRGLIGIQPGDAEGTEQAEDGEGQSPVSGQIPWQALSRIGLVRAFLATLWAIFRYPRSFFSKINDEEKPERPLKFTILLLFFMIPGHLLNAAIAFWFLPFYSKWAETQNQLPPAFQQFYTKLLESMPTEFDTMGTFYALLIVIPIQFILFEVLAGSFVQQFLLHRMRERRDADPNDVRKDFMVTLQVRCYAMAGRILLLVPVVGALVSVLASIALNVRGLQIAQRLSVGKALLVGVAPLLLWLLPVLIRLLGIGLMIS